MSKSEFKGYALKWELGPLSLKVEITYNFGGHWIENKTFCRFKVSFKLYQHPLNYSVTDLINFWNSIIKKSLKTVNWSKEIYLFGLEGKHHQHWLKTSSANPNPNENFVRKWSPKNFNEWENSTFGQHSQMKFLTGIPRLSQHHNQLNFFPTKNILDARTLSASSGIPRAFLICISCLERSTAWTCKNTRNAPKIQYHHINAFLVALICTFKSVVARIPI